MLQVLFHLPIFKDEFPPDGIPIHGFGVMLFITFILGVWFLGWRSRTTGTNLPRERVQDMVIVLFVSGLVGARIVYMIQFNVPARQIFRIWEGGIVLYGGIIAGILAYLAFFYLVLRRAGVSFWKLADVCGPGLALCIALGRIGCLLNGCCWGHVAAEGSPALNFPLLTCPSRDMVVDQQGLQTPTGFLVRTSSDERDRAADAENLPPEVLQVLRDKSDDIRSVVVAVEPESAAEKAGLLRGDRIVGVNGRPNDGVLLVVGPDAALPGVVQSARNSGGTVAQGEDGTGGRVKVLMDDAAALQKLRSQLRLDPMLRVYDDDVFRGVLSPGGWPRGDQTLTLEVERAGGRQTVGPFIPRTVGLNPTQVYETLSMLLLMVFLLAFHPFRHHDGQTMTLFIACYAIHRFLNEMLRNDTPLAGFQMTLSQNISLLMFAFAVCLEIGLRVRHARGTRAGVRTA